MSYKDTYRRNKDITTEARHNNLALICIRKEKAKWQGRECLT